MEMIINLLGLFFLFFLGYRLYFKPIKSYKEVTHRGFYYSIIGLKKD